MNRTKTVFAPAKINLCLHVLGRRSDGYHDLAMIMQRVSLYDRLHLELNDSKDVVVRCPGLELVDGETNIVEKAIRAFLRHVGMEQGVTCMVEKHIPAAAGLGGGSSDAAAVLDALNDMLGTHLPKAELMDLGGQLGADVPFFIFQQTAWATGTGNRLQAWPGLPPTAIVLVNPGISVSTAKIFQNLGLTHPRAIARIPRFPVGTAALVRLLHNDLEVVTCQYHPVITTIKESLIDSGAEGALMSGSGATVFGLFSDHESAQRAAENIQRETNWWVKSVRPI